MAFFTYLRSSNNLVTPATITATSEDVNFLSANAAALPVAKPWKSADGVTTGARMLIDFGSAKAVDAIAVCGHNLRRAATITVRAGTSPNPSGTEFQATLNHHAKNLLDWTEEFDRNLPWQKSFTPVITPDATTDPNGGVTADKIEDDSAGDFESLYQDVAVPDDSQTYTLSIYLRAGVGPSSLIRLQFLDGGTPILQDAIITWSGPTTNFGTLTAVGSDWFRLEFQTANNSTGNLRARVLLSPLSGSGTGHIFIWGTQLERNATVTAYEKQEGLAGPGLAWLFPLSTQTWRYWSFELDDAGNPDNHVRAGYAMLGVKTALSIQFDDSGYIVRPEQIVRAVENELGVPMVGSLVAEPERLAFQWRGLSARQRNEVRDFLLSLDLAVDPILLVPDSTDTEAWFARLQAGWAIEQSAPNSAAIPVEFLSDGFGLVTA